MADPLGLKVDSADLFPGPPKTPILAMGIAGLFGPKDHRSAIDAAHQCSFRNRNRLTFEDTCDEGYHQWHAMWVTGTRSS